jgi:putative flavoprotein involved in K+ transport
MHQFATEIFEIIIAGAGHAGLSMSYMLTTYGIKHIVFERGKIAETWRSQRWDSFALNTPGHMNILPGEDCKNIDAEGFLPRDNMVAKLKNYAEKFQLPVRENAKVISVTKKEEDKYFTVLVEHDEIIMEYTCRQVVIASGAMNAAKIPSFGNNLSKHIYQMHVLDYRSPSQLPEGNIMVIGSGQSGGQVAEDLATSGRKVYLSSSRVGRVPRRYRGRDILDWLCIHIPFYHALKSEITDPEILSAATPLVSGTGPGGHTLSLQYLHKLGVTILGRLTAIENDTMIFAPDARENVHYGDQVSQKTKEMIEEFIAAENFAAQAIEEDEADLPDVDASCVDDTLSFHCSDRNITSVIWTTGFTADFSWIKLPVLNNAGRPVHENGISPVLGLYFLGFPWLRSRKSGIIYGMTDDTAFLTNEILKNIRT